MTTLTNRSQLLIATQQMQDALHDFSFDNAEEVHSDDHAQSMPARGIILGIVGGVALWGTFIWAITKLL